jgi:hypothetical protein
MGQLHETISGVATLRKINKIYWLPILLLVGCMSPEISNTVTPAFMSTQATIVSSPTLPLETIISTPSSTPTEQTNIDEYLLSAASQEKYAALLLSNGGCELPCFWGFRVGESTWAETKTAMEKLHKIYEPENFYQDAGWPIHGVALQFIDPDYGAVLSPLEVTVDDKDIVQRLSLYVETDSGEALRHFWSYYSLRNIFAELGPPSRMVVSIYMKDLSRNGYQILVLYEEKKIAIWLEGDSKTGTSICPLIQKDAEGEHLRLSIANPASQLNILPNGWEFWSAMDDEKYNEDFLDTEEALGISTEEFYQKLLFDQVDCFDVIVLPE